MIDKMYSVILTIMVALHDEARMSVSAHPCFLQDMGKGEAIWEL